MACPPGKFEVMINADYGGFTMDDEVRDLYKYRAGKKYEGDREDLIMIQIYKEVGAEHFGGEVVLEYIEEKYRGHYDIHEYDGMESIQINIHSYQLQVLQTAIQELIDTEGDYVSKESLKQLSKS